MSDNSGYVFPVRDLVDRPGRADTKMGDMFLRDYFAGVALQGILARGSQPGALSASRPSLAAAAYEYADEMMKARER